ncbi:MAG: 30S ribosomal protein S6--L-glutamate ligase, partial [Gammaproteobacteria bacterium]|nr:30S ribosomal protein S6--L-glutamate ligase [Gammaproteobacteria bacterium]
MKIAVLSRGPKLYSTRRLVEGARARGPAAAGVGNLRGYMKNATATPAISYRGGP